MIPSPDDALPDDAAPDDAVLENITPDDITLEDMPAIPDAGGPEFERVDTCDHITDPECLCPEGWVRNGDWCGPDWHGGIDAVSDTVSDTGGAVSGTVDGGVGGVGEGAVDALGGFFGWAVDGLSEIPRLFADLGRWIIDAWQ